MPVLLKFVLNIAAIRNGQERREAGLAHAHSAGREPLKPGFCS
jgi:hypothetical protein